MLLQVLNVGVALEEPQEFVDDRLEMHLLGSEQRESLALVASQLVAEDALGARTGAVMLDGAVVEHMLQQVEILFHLFRLSFMVCFVYGLFRLSFMVYRLWKPVVCTRGSGIVNVIVIVIVIVIGDVIVIGNRDRDRERDRERGSWIVNVIVIVIVIVNG